MVLEVVAAEVNCLHQNILIAIHLRGREGKGGEGRGGEGRGGEGRGGEGRGGEGREEILVKGATSGSFLI